MAQDGVWGVDHRLRGEVWSGGAGACSGPLGREANMSGGGTNRGVWWCGEPVLDVWEISDTSSG